MPRPRTLIALFIALFGVASRGEAQFINGNNDPFSLYYGYLIPQQAYQASLPKPIDTVRAYSELSQARSLSAQAGLLNPGSLSAAGGSDPLSEFGGLNRTSRSPSTYSGGVINQNLGGTGPSSYFGRHSTYFPTIRTGRNASQAATLSTGSRGGGRR